MGDSVGMVVLGHSTTVPVTLSAMVHHCRAVSRGAATGRAPALLVGDLPFGTYTTEALALGAAVRLVQDGGMQAVKLEGGRAQSAKLARVVAEGIPVMGHVGLLPQTAALGGAYALRGRSGSAALQCVEDALAVQAAGAFSVVLEMVPAQLASFVTALLRIPTIGIGAGPGCAGQVLVAHDMLGVAPRAVPRFVKKYAELNGTVQAAVAAYADDVHARRFPAWRRDGGGAAGAAGAGRE